MKLFLVCLVLYPLLALSQTTERRLEKLEDQDTAHDVILNELSKIVAQNQLLISQGITKQENLQTKTDIMMTIISESKGALNVIQWIIMVTIPIITVLQFFEAYLNNKRSVYLENEYSRKHKYEKGQNYGI